ncbi:cytochrome P450 oxidoreductase [Cordyceps militaris]|uniref:Cytochrome P450 oxidoreductase n=1 Tax=Cordyceps militaris TaxID=73501 RepID=A0A2H4SMH4_CORMI|nr:cytochrome P450 oxidoreductase [Cordyceps militaris]
MDNLPRLDVIWAKPWLLLSAALLSLLVIKRLFFQGRSDGYVLPPGPKRLPLIGNLLDMQPQEGQPEFQHWLSHREQFGPMSSVGVMGQNVILLHDREAARFLLEKRSKSTSSRPHMEFGHNMCGFKNLLSVQKYGTSYVRRRRLVHQYLGTQVASDRYHSIQEVKSEKLLQRVLESPEALMDHLQGFSASVILDAIYGYTLESTGSLDPLVELIQRMLDNATKAFLPTAWFVDVVPAMRYIPGWFPGASFVRTAKKWKQTCEDAANMPFAFVKKQMQSGTHRPSYVSNILENIGSTENGGDDADGKPTKEPANEEDIKWTAATMYGGGVETTSSSLDVFVLAMILFPDVQRKAQQEIDRVIGTGRLPTFQDRASLPYTDSLVTEILRWFPVLPMGLPHTAQEDIVYKQYLIPKGSYLLPAAWWFCHDPESYADPEKFDPERYIAPRSEPDPRGVIFGFGRRICPGRYFADANLFIVTARLLAAFKMSAGVDEQGRERVAKLGYTISITTRPVKFPVSIAPRSDQHATLVRGISTTVSQ